MCNAIRVVNVKPSSLPTFYTAITHVAPVEHNHSQFCFQLHRNDLIELNESQTSETISLICIHGFLTCVLSLVMVFSLYSCYHSCDMSFMCSCLLDVEPVPQGRFGYPSLLTLPMSIFLPMYQVHISCSEF